jgi:DnaK suppressor protein
MDNDRAGELLARERARLEQALAELTDAGGDDELAHTDQHIADSGSDLYQREQDAGMATRLREELEALTRAEERLAAGKYGLSIESGEPIPDERLEAVPWAERTVAEQQRYDAH